MRMDEAAYLAARMALAALWLTAAIGAARYARGTISYGAPRRRVLAWSSGALFLVAVLISTADVGQNVVATAGQPVPWTSWLWLLFDGLAPIFLLLLLRAVAERDKAYARLDALARTGPLTGLANRRAFLEHAQAFLSAAARSGAPLALLLLGIDRFKAVNDRFGHDAGDAVLRAVAAALRGAIRVGDLPVRWGSEEFAVLLPGTDLPAAVALAERLRAAVRDGVPHPAGGRVTVSIGAARLGPGPPDAALDAALRIADAALYRAKASGRDRVEAASEADDATGGKR